MNFIENESAQKLRGGYYTPDDLASFLCRWVKGTEPRPKRVLEPSCGDGAFLEAMGRVRGFARASVVGFELDPAEAAKAAARARRAGLAQARVEEGDFLAWALDRLDDSSLFQEAPFDAVVGNPPFVRYQYLPAPFQKRAEEIFRRLGLPFTKHTNAWVPFVLASMALLRPGGRLAMVVPSEIIHVTHAQSLRSYLGRVCRRLLVIDPEELWFPGTLQGTVLLLAEKRVTDAGPAEGVAIRPVRGREFLARDPEETFRTQRPVAGATLTGKWTRALLGEADRNLVDALAGHAEVHRFDALAKVDVGIVTGANKYFLVTDETVERHNLRQWAYPMFGRSEHCPGVLYDERQHRENARDGNPTNFLWLREGKKDAALHAYVRLGETQQLHTRYKCRVRSPWYTVPSVYATEIGMLKRAHHSPRLILNRMGAYTTDTAYRIRARDIDAEKLVASFVNPLTALSAELEGRHYGGGVLELIPSEIERLLIPFPARFRANLPALDESIRTRDAAEMLGLQGRAVLGALGLARADQARLLAAWSFLRNRRQRQTDDGEAEV